MKLQLDTTLKTIKIEDKINLKELYEFLNQILPNNLWHEFTIEATVINNFTNPFPIYPSPSPWPIQPMQPFFPNTPSVPWITYGTTNDCKFNAGVYNIECLPTN